MVVAIALSGGVDSSVAAFLLHERHPSLIGASHLIWPDSRCCSAEVLSRAREVCRRLKIPYVQVDLFEPFRDEVVGDFIKSYLNGRTPNPCVLCNKVIRFDRFYSRLGQTLRERGTLAAGQKLLLSTGHYARIVQTGEGLFIGKGKDPVKDQSYMLYQVDKRMLSNLVLPLGDYLKSEIVSLAEKLDLPYTAIKESQDACFVGDSYVDFIEKQTGRSDFLQSGDITDMEGRVLGKHKGTIHYTVGQRRGLGLGDGPWYVARIDPDRNRVIVARREAAESDRFLIGSTNWFAEAPSKSLRCAVKVRYQVKDIPCRVEPEGQVFQVILDSPEIVTPGQSAVLYAGQLVLGGGVIL